MVSYSIDAERFINEIQNHRELWDLDVTGKPYRLKVKEHAWSKVAMVFIPDFQNMKKAERAEVYRKLYNKWRNIRDAYVRNIKGTRNLSKYIFMKQLQFLNARYKPDLISKPEAKCNDADDIDNEEENVNNSCESDEEMPSVIENLKRKRVSRKRLIEVTPPMHSVEITNDVFMDQESQEPLRRKNSELDSFVSMSQMKDNEESNYDITTTPSFDEDRSFFDSMLPAVRQFDMDQKLRFRYEVLRLIKDIRASVQNGFKPEPTSAYYVE